MSIILADYEIVVSEPFGYKNTFSENIIYGKIIKVLSPLAILFQSDFQLEFDGSEGSILLLKTRYEGQTLTIQNSFQGTVGGFILTSDYDNKDLNYLESHNKYVIIGGLRKR